MNGAVLDLGDLPAPDLDVEAVPQELAVPRRALFDARGDPEGAIAASERVDLIDRRLPPRDHVFGRDRA